MLWQIKWNPRKVLVSTAFTGAALFFSCHLALGEGASFSITSSAFNNNEPIPSQFTGDGKNISPPLAFHNLPAGTKYLALVVDDPDAPMGDWVHWEIYNIPASAQGLPGNVPVKALLADGTRQGSNSFKNIGYGGPEPPPGKVHHYHFKLYALRAPINPAGSSKGGLLAAFKEQAIAECELIGTYKE